MHSERSAPWHSPIPFHFSPEGPLSAAVLFLSQQFSPAWAWNPHRSLPGMLMSWLLCCLFSLPFSPLSKQCQYRLMVSLSDPKQRSLWLVYDYEAHSCWLCSTFICLPVLRWDTNMLTDYPDLSLTRSLNCSIFLLVSYLPVSPSHPIAFQETEWTVCSRSKPPHPNKLIFFLHSKLQRVRVFVLVSSGKAASTYSILTTKY